MEATDQPERIITCEIDAVTATEVRPLRPEDNLAGVLPTISGAVLSVTKVRVAALPSPETARIVWAPSGSVVVTTSTRRRVVPVGHGRLATHRVLASRAPSWSRL